MLKKLRQALPVLVITIIALVVLFWRLDYPALPIFDEVYHLSSAQRYLNGKFFQENHPPLGKLFIALGEKLLDKNPVDRGYDEKDKLEGDPPTTNYIGYRFFPALLALTGALMIYLTLSTIGVEKAVAMVASLALLLDNAFLVQSRAAMLDGTLLAFLGLNLWMMAKIWKQGTSKIKMIIWGLLWAMLVTVKHTGWIILLPASFLIGELVARDGWIKTFRMILLTIVSFLVAYVLIWQAHYFVAGKIGENDYQISEVTRTVLEGKENRWLATPSLIFDAWKYSDNYNQGVPKLDLCKSDEVGSPWYYWLFGGRVINFRWEAAGETANRYMDLIPNPATWLGVLIIVFLGTTRFVTDLVDRRERVVQLSSLAIMTYWAYLLAIAAIPRVMYLYHYLPALYFGILLMGIEINKIAPKLRRLVLIFLVTSIFINFWFMKPFTYFEPMTANEFNQRILLPIWEMKKVN